MDIVYYCSYKGSPDGFHIGKVSIKPEYGEGSVSLRKDGIPKKTMEIFQFTSDALGSFGKIPQTGIYEVLKKNIKGNVGDEKHDPLKLNFSIVCDSENEYLRAKTFVNNCKNNAEIFRRFADPIVIYPDDSEFGILIDNAKLNKLYSDIMQSEPHAALDETYIIEGKNGNRSFDHNDKEVSPSKGSFRGAKEKNTSPGCSGNKKGKNNSKDHILGNTGNGSGGKGAETRRRQKIIISAAIICVFVLLLLLKEVVFNGGTEDAEISDAQNTVISNTTSPDANDQAHADSSINKSDSDCVLITPDVSSIDIDRSDNEESITNRDPDRVDV